MTYGGAPYGGAAYGGVVMVAQSELAMAGRLDVAVTKNAAELAPDVDRLVGRLDLADIAELAQVGRELVAGFAEVRAQGASLEEQIRQLLLAWDKNDIGWVVDRYADAVPLDIGRVLAYLGGGEQAGSVEVRLPEVQSEEASPWLAACVLWLGALIGGAAVGAAVAGSAALAVILGALFALLVGLVQLADRIP